MSLRRRLLILVVIAFCISSADTAEASGPRWVTGNPYFYNPGYPIVWYTDNPLYFTDPGDLSIYVNHAAADAIVDAAASVWNVQTSRLTIARGGLLDEHISAANVYPSSTGIVMPTDVQASNFPAKQIAVIYDSDGSVTDILLGAGASDPTSCRQNAVTESVDQFQNDGHIQHAILVLNGRCTGPAPEQQLQLQYQLMRAFGRILGLGWSQTNDNVFTGVPGPTYQEALHWPVMHPIDVICGPYTYQCMPSPFTLRDDDVAGVDLLYPTGYTLPPGRTNTSDHGSAVHGTITFPNGQGMQGVNVVVHRLEPFWNYPEEWESVSAVTGQFFRRSNGNPVTGGLAGPPTIGMGSTDPTYEGLFDMSRIPLYDWEAWQNLVISTQPVNPLYTGVYAVGPYDTNGVSPSGSGHVEWAWTQGPYVYTYISAIPDAAGSCDTSTDGTESAPAQAPATGWWTGNLCSYGHAAWSSLIVQPGRSFTFEVTAQDEQGLATTSKALPVLGVWNAADATGTLPSVAAATSPFNSAVNGMTRLNAVIGPGAQPQQLRLVVADRRGDGRPDYGYQARIFYADAISPANIPAFGGTVTVTGMGFRAGNTVTVNGVAASVTGWTANSMTAVVPSLHASTSVVADVTVKDLVTGAVSTMSGALTYNAPRPALMLSSAPTGVAFTGSPAPVPLSLRAVGSDGTTPLAGIVVSLSVNSDRARFDACASGSCSLTTDAQGRILTTVTPLAPGAVQMTAASSIGTVTAAFDSIEHVQSLTAQPSAVYLAAGSQVTWNAQVSLADNGASTAGVPVQWGVGVHGMEFEVAISASDSNSLARNTVTAGPLFAGVTATASVCAWTGVCTALSAAGVGPEQWTVEVVSGGSQSLTSGTPLAPVVLRVVDSQGHAIAGAPVEVHQALEPWVPACPPGGRCPIAPVYRSSAATLISAIDGTVTITPLEEPGDEPMICRIVAATGTQGFLPLALQRQP